MPRSTKFNAISQVGALLGVLLAVQSVGAQELTAAGGEYPIVGSYVGDQVFASAAYNGRYGFVVWQDSRADGKGSGIVARQLSAGFSAGLSPAFRINQLPAGEQERPKVALFPDGSAVFCWHGGEIGKQKVYARFLDKKGFFPAAEVVVSQSTTEESLDVSVAVLKSGNAVLIWSTFGADGDLQGVFGRLIDPKGKFLGSVFQVNQYTPYNQRNPEVTALADGGFAVCWVSEQQRMAASELRGAASIDTYVRVYDATATAKTDEFRVNTSNLLCANPCLSSTEGGNLVVAWSERAVDRSNGWDIVSAVYSADATMISAPTLLNTYRRGNQYVPTIARLGDLHLVTWTSGGQDGNREGVFGRALRGGSPTGAEFRVNSWTPSSQVQPVTVSDGISESAVIFSTFLAGRGFDLHAQRYSALSTVPQPEAPFVAASSLGSLQANWPELVGYDLDHYELLFDGGASLVLSQNHYSVLGLAPGSAHAFRLRYVLKSGAQSLWSPTANGTVWGDDNNSDGVPDDWQAAHWGSDRSKWPSVLADSDGDGASNRNEFEAGTDPLDSTSVLKLTVSQSHGATVLHWNTLPGNVYQVQISEGLPIEWKDLGPIRFARGDSDTISVSHQGRSSLYRVVRLQ